ncbi:type I methionyl aminopeptidase [Segetibacter sp. 3557_3]|uniref:type I methionyl aminopeptidase n=1 Tax=Segetibacter sp. 3557_3 TaxID=2547429 RepID=UPI001058801C|nr:type I methionyl aminopeptidase [Segetibacter sp. 3557_3]TDH26857.1 type I methionyl aminopeptidase [Segetibacter sp. 3557_3]
MIHYKTDAEIELMRKSNLLVSQAIAEVAGFLKPGVTTKQANDLAETVIRDNGGVPSFLNYRGFPFAACISVNDAVVHGFPTSDVLKDGDVVSVDLGVFMNNFHGDSAYTFALGEVDEAVLNLLRVTKASLYKGIEKAHHGNRIGDIAFAIQDYTEKVHGYGVVRELVGHGIGKSLHEDPQMPNFGKRGNGPKLKEGMVLAIEPMINLGVKEVFYDDDGWTVRTKDRKPSAHYEHSVAIRKSGADILSSFAGIEVAEKSNPNLNSAYH